MEIKTSVKHASRLFSPLKENVWGNFWITAFDTEPVFFIYNYTSESSLIVALGGHRGDAATAEDEEGIAIASRLLRKESLSRLYMSSGKVSWNQ